MHLFRPIWHSTMTLDRQVKTASLDAVVGDENTIMPEGSDRSIKRDEHKPFGAEHSVRTDDLRLGNSEGPDSRTFPALHSESKSSLSFGTVAQADPRISHAASQKHESLGPTGVQENLLPVAAVARRLGVCTATVYGLCSRGELAHVRVTSAIRIAPADLEAFVAARRSHQ